jgi:predicted dehydrogenase
MRVGIMSFAHLHALSYVHHLGSMPDMELIGMSDDDAARGKHYAGQYNLKYFDTYEALLAEKPDAVVICSENAYHHRLTVMAAEAGAHVLCEKPLMTSMEEGKAMLAVCEKAGVKLMTAFPMRFNAPTIEGKKVVDSGSLGKIYGCSTTNQGKMPREIRWFTDKKLAGGGALTDHTVHVADLLRWYLGCEVVEVFAESNAILNSDFKPEVETGGIVMLKFENGTFATIDCSWSKPPFYPTWGGVTMELVGETGVLSINAFKQTIAVYSHESDRPSWPFWGSDSDGGMIHEFLSAVRENRQPAVTGYDGFKAAEIALAAHRSVEIGQPVSLPLEA